MRKILLATTSLVAMSVTAAQADLSISGSYEFGYYQTSGGTNSTGSDGNITFSGTGASENGVTYSVVANNGIHSGSVEDAYLQMAGDFGTLRLGFTDSMVDTNDGVLGKSQFVYGMNDISTEIDMDTNGVNDETVAAFHYQSAELIPGLTAYGTAIPNGVTGYGIKYSNDIATVIYQIAGGGGTDQTLVGVGFNVGGFGINAGSLESTTAAVKTTQAILRLAILLETLELLLVKSNRALSHTTLLVQLIQLLRALDLSLKTTQTMMAPPRHQAQALG